jgi:Tfp pilus assembly protein PilF
MTVLRVLAGGVVLGLAALGCAARGGAGDPAATAPDEGAVASQGATIGEGAAVSDAGPTEQLAGLREELARAREDGGLTKQRCEAWADELVALHVRHGEPYVGARLEAATLLHECGQPLEARARLLEALEAMPRWARAEALNTLGVLAHESGDDGGALVHLQAALHADPALHEARGNLVRLLLRIYDGGGSDFARDDARRNLETWIELAPDDPRARVQLARFHVIRARREPAAAGETVHEAKLLLALVLQQRHPPVIEAEVFVVLGQLRLDDGDEVTALRAFKRALELDPGCGSAALLGATVLLRMRGFVEAHQVLETAAATVDPVEERTRLRLLAVALRGLTRYDEAAEVYERLLSAAKPEPVDLYNRVQLELHRLEREPDFDAAHVEVVRQRLAEVIAATHGNPAHAEIEQRARAELQTLDEQYGSAPSPHRSLYPEAAALAEQERKAWPKERKRRLELEAKAREARERSRLEGPGAQ